MTLHGPVRALAAGCALILAIYAVGAAAAPPAENAYDPSKEIRYGDAAAFRNLIPTSMLEQQAAAEYQRLLKSAAQRHRLLPATNAQVKRVRGIAQKLIPASFKWNEHAKQWHWEVNVIRDPQANVMCLPGGKIVVFTGMLDTLVPNDNELGMLLAHEIAHALREHARERLGKQQALQMEVGEVPQLFGLADMGRSQLGIGAQLLTLKFSHDDETEADVIGTDIAARAGFDPRAGITLWNRLAARSRTRKDFISRHPFNQSRITDLKKRLPDMLALYAKAIGKPVKQLPAYVTRR